MKKKIKKYRVSADDSLGLAMSVVNRPAVESDFQFFSEQKLEKFVGVEGERRMIYGCALRPDFPIYRNDGKEEYYLEFTKEAVDKISKNYFKMGFQSSWTEGHKEEVEGLTITESWIKESMTMDKSIALGLDANLPLGSWFIGCYCENDEIWNAVKDGTYHGFSIEAIVGIEEFSKQEQNTNNMNIETNDMFWDKLKNILKETFSKKVEEPTVEELAANSGFTNVEDYQKEVEAVKAELEEQNAQEPTVEPIVEPTVEEPKPEEEHKVDEPVVEEPKVEDKPKEDNTKHLEELIGSLKEEINALKEMNSGLNDKVKELSKEPSAKPVNTNAKPSAADTYSAWREQMRSMIG